MSDRLPAPKLVAYGLPSLALAALTLPLYLVVPTFYAESLGLSVAGIGYVLLLVRLFDAVNDPLAGYLGDRWRPGTGRRKTLFALAVPLAMLGAWKLFWPPADADLTYLLIWSVVLSVAYTLVYLPYLAWGTELGTSYDERSRVAAFREIFTPVGTIIAVSIPFAIGWADPNSFHGLALLAAALVIALPLTSIIALIFVPEPNEYSKNSVSLTEGIRIIAGNRPFLRLAIAFFLSSFGSAVAATLFLLFVSERLGLGEFRGPLLLLYLAFGIVGIPVWLHLSRKTSKHRTWCVALILATIAFFPTPFLPEGMIWPFAIVCVLTGLTAGADLLLGPSIKADVIDVDTAQSGEQRTAIYLALWSFLTKAALALAVGLSFPLLDTFGFDASADGTSTALGISMLGFFYGWGPIALKLPALALMWNFPLTERDVVDLRKKIQTNST